MTESRGPIQFDALPILARLIDIAKDEIDSDLVAPTINEAEGLLGELQQLSREALHDVTSDKAHIGTQQVRIDLSHTVPRVYIDNKLTRTIIDVTYWSPPGEGLVVESLFLKLKERPTPHNPTEVDS